MRKSVRKVLGVFYWMLGISAFLGATVVGPWTDREAMRIDGWEWWYITLTIWGVLALVAGMLLLHCWAFKEGGVK